VNTLESDEETRGGAGSPSKAELFELIVESATDFAIFTIDPRRTVTSWNVGAERLFGYTEKEMLGSSGDIIFTPEDRADGAPEREVATADRDGRAVDERWHRRKDGSRFWAAGLMMPLRGNGRGFVKIARDRTEQHVAGERLRENEARFRLLATSIPQLVFIARPDGHRTWGSPQWIEYTGRSLEEGLDFGWLDAVHPDDRVLTQDAWREAQDKGECYVEHRVQRADGAYRWHQTRAKPLDRAVDASTDWVGTTTDIHDLRGLKDRQQVLMRELEHRTQNLLAVVQSMARRTIRSSSSLEAFGKEFEGRLHSLGRVQGLLARVDDHTIDLQTLVAAELAAHADGDEPQKIAFGGPRVSLSSAAAQAVGLGLHELATNAVKYGALAQPAGKLSVTWRFASEPPPPQIILEWVESGVAMPARSAAPRRGYGSELIERVLPLQLRAQTSLSFTEDGVRCTISVPMSESRAQLGA
jgi:PAS domain S-box-containing protein